MTNDLLQPEQNYNIISCRMYGTEPRYNEPQFNEILVITNWIQKCRRKIYLDITNTCQHVTERQLKNAKQINEDKIYVYSSFKQFFSPVLVFLVP